VTYSRHGAGQQIGIFFAAYCGKRPYQSASDSGGAVCKHQPHQRIEISAAQGNLCHLGSKLVERCRELEQTLLQWQKAQAIAIDDDLLAKGIWLDLVQEQRTPVGQLNDVVAGFGE